ncbi:MAG: GNAT family N-acetyltransferase [Proteiniphilum sp.]|nr:GNAT family N-acetyltransferase [Proteiniphilum sp.]
MNSSIDDDVVLRELMDSDIPKLVEHANNKKVFDNVRDAFPHPYTLEAAKSFKAMTDKQEPRNVFAIEYKGEYVGNIGLHLASDVYRKSAEIGYFIGEPFWNKGIVTRAVRLITEWGFNHLDIVRIYTGVFEFNKASQRVLEKCGFIREGIFRKVVFKNGTFCDEVRFAKIKD